jgi:zinc metalloprotease ZmpB
MPLELGPDVAVTRDSDGVVRALNHVQAPYVGRRGVKPAELAAAYLEDAAEVFGLDAEITLEEVSDSGPDPGDTRNRLVLAEQKSLMGASTLGFQQRLGGLPIWEAGVSLLAQERPPQVVLARSQYRRDVKVDWIKGKPKLDPRKPTPAALAKLLGVGDPKQFALKINGPAQWWLYRFERAQRKDPESRSKDQRGRSQGPPTLVLPEVDPRIEEGVHYPALEVLFRLAVPSWGALNWRAFVEPVTGSVLYLRAFVACATGRVYPTDPTVQTGNLSLRARSASTTDLDNQRSTLTLPGLEAPTGSPARQALRGNFVVIQDTNPPTSAPPTTISPFFFDFSSPTDGFAAAATYFHADACFRLVQNLGFTVATYFNGTTFPVPVDHRGRTDVNANCEGNTAGNGVGRFRFGPCDTGTTVGMGTEGRTVYHEFGHALLWDNVNSPNFGFAHSAGDSLAMIVTDPHTLITGSDRFIVFTFCPLGTTAAADRRADRLPGDGWAWGGMRDTGGYPSEEILTSTLFRVYRSLGGDSVQQSLQEFASRYSCYLIIKSIGALAGSPITPTPEPDDYADELMAADRLTTNFEGYSGGAMHKVVRWSFEKQGLYQPPGAATPVTAPGAPPDVDVYINDGRNGEYQFRENFWDTTEIWNRSAPDAGLTHQEPVVGATNYAYVIIRNRGTTPATGITVRGYHSRPMTGLIWPADWAPMSTASLPGPASLAAGANAMIGPFEWTPNTVGHECMLMIVSATGDRSVVDSPGGTVTGGSIPHWRLVPHDNNIAQRNVAPIAGFRTESLIKSLSERVFWIKHPEEAKRPVVVLIDVKLPPLLAKLGWDIDLKGVKRPRFTLKPGQQVKVALVATPGEPITPKLINAQRRPPRIDVNIELDGIVAGGMTFPIDPKWKG